MMKAKTFLSQVGTEYRSVREIRERLREEKDRGQRKILRSYLKSAASSYAGILSEVWDMVDLLEKEMDRDILTRRYMYLESWDQVSGEMGCAVATLYKRHSQAVRRLQRLLNDRDEWGGTAA